jgi:hypothetical protein
MICLLNARTSPADEIALDTCGDFPELIILMNVANLSESD